MENEWTGRAERDIGNDLALPHNDGWSSPEWSWSADAHIHCTDTHTHAHACTAPDRDMLNAEFFSGSRSASHQEPPDHVSLSPRLQSLVY